MRLAAATAVLSLATASPAIARAQSKKECAQAYVEAQVDRKEGRLIKARQKLEVCNAPTCPAALRRDCGPWLAQADKDIPVLSIKVEGESGPVTGARVTVDGAPFEGGRPLDPGDHVVRVEAEGKKPSEQSVRLAAGDGRREIVVRLDPEAPKPPPPAKVPVAPIALGAAGVVGLAVFIGLGAAGNGQKADLDKEGCKPNCSPDSVASIKTLYIAADVALGVGLASLVAGGVLLGLHLAAPKQSAGVASRVGLVPARGGGGFEFRF